MRDIRLDVMSTFSKERPAIFFQIVREDKIFHSVEGLNAEISTNSLWVSLH